MSPTCVGADTATYTGAYAAIQYEVSGSESTMSPGSVFAFSAATSAGESSCCGRGRSQPDVTAIGTTKSTHAAAGTQSARSSIGSLERSRKPSTIATSEPPSAIQTGSVGPPSSRR